MGLVQGQAAGSGGGTVVPVIAAAVAVASAVVASSPAYAAEGEPVLALPPVALVENYCLDCHDDSVAKGDLNLLAVLDDDVAAHPVVWEKVLKRLAARQMPPAKKKSRPSESEYSGAVGQLAASLDALAQAQPNPGRVETFRRLNRTEYQNAVRDLLAVDIDAAALLPKDEESFGFDNVTVGTLSPSLLDRYITAAQKVGRLAVGRQSDRVRGDTFRAPGDYTQEKHVEGLPLGTRGGLLIDYTFPQDGEYEIEARLTRDRNEHVEGLHGEHEMVFLLDREEVAEFEVSKKGKRHSDVDKHLKARLKVTAGPKQVGVTFRSRSYSLLENKRQPFAAHFNLHRHPRLSPAVYQVSITGPFDGQGAGDTPSRERVFAGVEVPADGGSAQAEAAAWELLGRLARRAYRGAATPEDVEKLMAFYRDGSSGAGGFDGGIEAALQALLVNPSFLFRIEREPADVPDGGVYRISDLELASRLSFFIWSSIPDEGLLAAAEDGRLSDPDELGRQVRRMLADPRSSNLVENFASQWLHLRNLEAITPDLRLFPDFDDNLRQAFRRETEMFVADVVRHDRSVLDLLKSDHTFLNERLARHYGIPGVFGSRFRRVALEPGHHRGGLLRHGSILTVTSYATRTSPVIRGNWVLENIMGTPPPPPPPDVPALEDNQVDADAPMRERLAEHRDNPGCRSCHEIMDPVGFALENYDAVGRWREFENGRPVDASGGLPDGSVFEGAAALEDGLLERPEMFVYTLGEKLLTFALGRGVEESDAPAVRQAVRAARDDGYRFSALVLGIAESVPFQMRAKSGREVAGLE